MAIEPQVRQCSRTQVFSDLQSAPLIPEPVKSELSLSVRATKWTKTRVLPTGGCVTSLPRLQEERPEFSTWEVFVGQA